MTIAFEVDVEATDGGAYINVADQRIDLSFRDALLIGLDSTTDDEAVDHMEAVEHALVDLAARALLACVDLRKQRADLGVRCDQCNGAGGHEDWRGRDHECPYCDATGRIKGAVT